MRTTLPAKGIRGRGDVLFKSYERMFLSRGPLSDQAQARVTVSDPWSYAEIGEAVEAWGFRCMQHEQRFLDRSEVARRWWAEEYTPVVRMLREADLLGSGTEAEAGRKLLEKAPLESRATMDEAAAEAVSLAKEPART